MRIVVTISGRRVIVQGGRGPRGVQGPAADVSGKADKLGTADIEITDYSKGIILRTSDGTRARIVLVKRNGTLALQMEQLA